MRKVIYGGAVSLDLYLAGPDEDIGWIRRSDDAAELTKTMWKTVDTMLMGRKTYDFALRMGGPISWDNVRTYVFSRTLEEVSGGAELVRGDVAEFVRELKAKPGGDIIIMGGGEIGTCLIEAGLVDEIGFNIHPVILGRGTPALGRMGRQVELELVETRQLGEGCVLVRYRMPAT